MTATSNVKARCKFQQKGNKEEKLNVSDFKVSECHVRVDSTAKHASTSIEREVTGASVPSEVLLPPTELSLQPPSLARFHDGTRRRGYDTQCDFADEVHEQSGGGDRSGGDPHGEDTRGRGNTLGLHLRVVAAVSTWVGTRTNQKKIQIQYTKQV